MPTMVLRRASAPIALLEAELSHDTWMHGRMGHRGSFLGLGKWVWNRREDTEMEIPTVALLRESLAFWKMHREC